MFPNRPVSQKGVAPLDLLAVGFLIVSLFAVTASTNNPVRTFVSNAAKTNWRDIGSPRAGRHAGKIAEEAANQQAAKEQAAGISRPCLSGCTETQIKDTTQTVTGKLGSTYSNGDIAGFYQYGGKYYPIAESAGGPSTGALNDLINKNTAPTAPAEAPEVTGPNTLTTNSTVQKTDEGFIRTYTTILRDATGKVIDALSVPTTSQTTSKFRETDTGVIRTDTRVTKNVNTGEVIDTNISETTLPKTILQGGVATLVVNSNAPSENQAQSSNPAPGQFTSANSSAAVQQPGSLPAQPPAPPVAQPLTKNPVVPSANQSAISDISNFPVFLQYNTNDALNVNNFGISDSTRINDYGGRLLSWGCGPSTAYNILRYTGYDVPFQKVLDTYFWSSVGSDGPSVLLDLRRNGFPVDTVDYGTSRRMTDAYQLNTYNGLLVYNGSVSSPGIKSVDHIAAFDCKQGDCYSIDSYFSSGKPIKCDVEGSGSVNCGGVKYKVGETKGSPGAFFPVKSP